MFGNKLDMTPDAQEIVDLIKKQVTREMVRKMVEENKGMVALFKQSFRGIAWFELEGEDRDRKGTKTLLVSMGQDKSQGKTSLDDLEASKGKKRQAGISWGERGDS